MSPIFQLNKLNSITTATSLIIGAATKKEKVTPIGIPASRKPMKRGIAEQEQNGVTIPSKPAKTFPPNNDLPSSFLRVFSGEKNDRAMPAIKMTSTSKRNIFCTTLKKNHTVSEKFDS